MRDGWPVRTLLCPPREAEARLSPAHKEAPLLPPAHKEAPGSILFITGRGDFMEKYCETFHDLVDAGWGVASFDWRGQGLSGRLGDTAMKGHSPGFDNWLSDLDEMIGWFEASLPRPWFAVAHSMGGHLLQRHLAGENGEFRRAVLLSPMLGVAAWPLGPTLARWLARLMVRLGFGGAFIPGGGPYVTGVAGSRRQRLLTSDPERHADEGWWVEQVPALALGSVTYGWLDAAFRSLAALFSPPPAAHGTGEGTNRRPMLQRITTPMLILIPEHDGLVDNRVTRRTRGLMPLTRLEEVPGAGHELLREAGPVRARVLARLVRFLREGV